MILPATRVRVLRGGHRPTARYEPPTRRTVDLCALPPYVIDAPGRYSVEQIQDGARFIPSGSVVEVLRVARAVLPGPWSRTLLWSLVRYTGPSTSCTGDRAFHDTLTGWVPSAFILTR